MSYAEKLFSSVVMVPRFLSVQSALSQPKRVFNPTRYAGDGNAKTTFHYLLAKSDMEPHGRISGAYGPSWTAVKFVLADFGFSGSVRLLKVKFNFYISYTPPDAVRIHVYASDGVTPLCCTPNLDQTFPDGWNEIDLSSRMSAPISGAFYVAYEHLGQYSSAIRYDNAASVGHSYTGGPGAWTSYDLNFMIRAEVDPAQVGAPVGGFMEPVNKPNVFAPYLALFGLVAAVAIVVVKPWKKSEP